MRLLRVLLALGILYLANGLYRLALRLKQPVSASKSLTNWSHFPNRRAQMHPVEQLLLGSLIGLAICALWIAMTWRAWS